MYRQVLNIGNIYILVKVINDFFMKKTYLNLYISFVVIILYVVTYLTYAIIMIWLKSIDRDFTYIYKSFNFIVCDSAVKYYSCFIILNQVT